VSKALQHFGGKVNRAASALEALRDVRDTADPESQDPVD